MHRYVARIWSGMSLTAILGITSFAQAESQCVTSTDCAPGYVCEVTGGSGCTTPACPPNTVCPEVEPCEAVEYRSCVPGPCESDADCAAGMKCQRQTRTACHGGGAACAPNTECPPPEPDECTTEVVSQCVPPYALPCETHSDCGAGFLCVEQPEQCSCAGSSGGAATPDGGTFAPDPDPDCDCRPGGRACELIEVTCTSAGDCPSGWSCSPGPDTPVSGDCAKEPGSDAGCTSVPPPAPAELLCTPPGYRAPSGETQGEPTASGSGAPEAPGSGESADDDGATGSGSGSSGCQMSSQGGGQGAGVLLILGFAATRLLRRKRTG